MFVIVMFISACNSQNGNSHDADKPEVTATTTSEKAFLKFTKKKYNFGQVASDKKVSVVFEFENTGSKTLFIQKVDVSCGCTASEWTKHPIERGGKGYVKVVFDPKDRSGVFSKSIFVKSNAENDVELLKIEGEVI